MNRQSSSTMTKTPSYFQGCPLSKFITFSTILSHVVLEQGGFHGGAVDLLSLNLEDVIVHGEIYRLLLHNLTFGSMGELVMGLMVYVPLMIQFERELGTKKLASFGIKCLLLATVLQVLFLFGLGHYLISTNRTLSSTSSSSSSFLSPPSSLLSLNKFQYATGPYTIIGSLFYLYHTYTPRLHVRFMGILGMDFSEKSLTYGLTFITIYSQGWASILPFLFGYWSSFLSIQDYDNDNDRKWWNFYRQWECTLPNFVYSIADNVAKVFGLDSMVVDRVYFSRNNRLASAAAFAGRVRDDRRRGMDNRANQYQQERRPMRRQGGTGNVGLNENNRGLQPQFQRMPPPQPPSQESIDQLTAMGFERDAVVRALSLTDNNVEAAANRLLSGN